MRKAAQLDPSVATKLVGTYETATGFKVQVKAKEGTGLVLVSPGQPEVKLLPYKGLKFRSPEFSDLVFEFVLEKDRVTALKQTDPSGEYTLTRK